MLILFAAENSLPPLSYPWWVTNAIVPLGISLLVSVVGTLLTFLYGFTLLRRTELYRRLSRWEPYHKELWLLRIKLYGEVCGVALKATRVGYDKAYRSSNAEPDTARQMNSEYKSTMAELDLLENQAKILLSDNFNEVFVKFCHKVNILGDDSHVDPQWRFRANKDSDEMFSLYGQLLEAARASLCIDALGDKAVATILENLKEGQHSGARRAGELMG